MGGTVLVLTACITLVTGLAMAIDYLGVGAIVRFIPTTVVSGFIAGTGWLLIKGGFKIMVDFQLGRFDLDASPPTFWYSISAR